MNEAVTSLSFTLGPQSTGKAAYFTAIFPYIVLFILLGRGLSLPGWRKGIEFFLIPKWHKLLEPGVWGEAAVQVHDKALLLLKPGFPGE